MATGHSPVAARYRQPYPYPEISRKYEIYRIAGVSVEPARDARDRACARQANRAFLAHGS
jgi:hypothetical protein